jgi:hypothetical protein
MNTYVINLNGKYIGEIYADKVTRTPGLPIMLRFYTSNQMAHARIWLEDGMWVGGLPPVEEIPIVDLNNG